MAESVEPYLAWLRSTAQQCQQIAVAAQDAVAAFTSVRAAVIPVALVRANRTRLAQLLATNQFGINLPAIAETEDEYQGMWANNSAAMSRYLVASAQATTLPLFSSPAVIADPAGSAAQAGVVSAAASPAASSPISSIISAIQAFDPTKGWVGLADVYAYQFVASGFPVNMLSYLAQLTAAKALRPWAATLVRVCRRVRARCEGWPGERASSAPPACRQNPPRRSEWACRWAS